MDENPIIIFSNLFIKITNKNIILNAVYFHSQPDAFECSGASLGPPNASVSVMC